MNGNQPVNRAQRRAENKRNQIRNKREEQQKINELHSAIAKNPQKKQKIEKSYHNFDSKKVLIMTVAIMLVFFLLLGFVFYPLMS